jgi:hypothetical protein
MISILFFFTFSVFAASESTDAFDKSFPRDNTFCSYKGSRVELLIRSESKFTEPKERGYGELIFYRHPPKRPSILNFNVSKADTFKLFNGVSPLCSKSHGYQIDDETMAILLLKENRPFKDKLVLQLFDLKTLSPKESIETNYLTDRAKKTKTGFAFNTYRENHNPEMGKVLIQGQEFIFQEKDFPQWVEYSNKSFSILSDLTFETLPWKNLFQDQEDFMTVTGWNPVEKNFSKKIVYFAINHKLKKRCLLFIESKQKLTGSESWRCQTI